MKLNKFSPKQGEILKFAVEPEYILVCDGAVRSGKSSIMTIAFIIWAMEYFDHTNFAICGKTVTSTERNIIKPYQTIKNLPYKNQYKRVDRLLVVKCGRKQNNFYVFGGKDESSYALIQGITLAGVLFDEVALMPKSFVDQAIARTLTYPNAKLWFNCNPEDPEHWFYNDFILQERGSTKRIHFLMSDNPIMTEPEIEKASKMFTGIFYLRYVLGLWVRAEGVIFRQFAENPDNWIVDTIPNDLEYITFGLDFGESTSHTVFVATGIRRAARGIIALDDFKLESKGVSPDVIEREFVVFAQRVMECYPGIRLTYAWGDHPETIVNGIAIAVKKAKLPLVVIPAKKEEIVTRIYAQEKMLNLHLMSIMRRCTLLIHSLKNQVWDEKRKDKNGKNIRLDNNPNIADVADAWEYSFEAFIDEIGVRQ